MSRQTVHLFDSGGCVVPRAGTAPRAAHDRRQPGAPSGALQSIDGVVVTALGVERFECPVCEAPRDLVVPDCGDDQDDCSDRACAECGFAISLGGQAVLRERATTSMSEAS